MRRLPADRNLALGMSLVEVLIVLAVIGVIAAIAIPTVGKINDSSKKAAAIANAQNVARLSAALSSFGVAHVIPDSMGGVEATARLLREGVVITEGPMAGEKMSLAALKDPEITELSKYLDIQYGESELMLIFIPPGDIEAILFLRDLSSMFAIVIPGK